MLYEHTALFNLLFCIKNMKKNVIYWFRQDLRLADNPAFTQATQSGKVLPIYILDDVNTGRYAIGAASCSWLYRSLKLLDASLDNKLSLFVGDPYRILHALIQEFSVSEVFWNDCYEPWRTKRDAVIKSRLQELGVEVITTQASLLWDPRDVLKHDKSPYRVFTPFYKNGCLKNVPPRDPISKPHSINLCSKKSVHAVDIDSMGLMTSNNKHLANQGHPGEKHAHSRLQDFLKHGLSNYEDGRNFPAQPYTSGLAPYLHFGEISPHQVWHAVKLDGKSTSHATFLKEVGWREFCYNVLYYFPELPYKNLQSKFDALTWEKHAHLLNAWQNGKTGYPFVDAGMRELQQTGTMHNRVRMITASFLVKNLMIHWHEGLKWFWEHLFDADLASNSFNWQWVAGCGADAAPYFRVFNPTIQAKKFDPQGDYIRKFVPELAHLPQKYLFEPIKAPEKILQQAGVILGTSYPLPIVDLDVSRKYTLKKFNALKYAK